MAEEEYAQAFDELAETYDLEFTSRARPLRQFIWSRMEGVFQRGDLVLDIGCGTGEDAGFLARRGIRVVATDISPAMIGRAAVKLEPYQDRVSLAVLEAARLEEHFQGLMSSSAAFSPSPPVLLSGIISNFGVLNCLPALAWLRRLSDRYLKRGGYLFLCAINRFYFREVLRGVFRRLRPSGTPVKCGSRRVPLYYHSPAALRWPGYELLDLYGLSVFLRADIHRRWPFNRCGDHYLAVLRKRNF